MNKKQIEASGEGGNGGLWTAKLRWPRLVDVYLPVVHRRWMPLPGETSLHA
jgi:hypothetical protein